MSSTSSFSSLLYEEICQARNIYEHGNKNKKRMNKLQYDFYFTFITFLFLFYFAHIYLYIYVYIYICKSAQYLQSFGFITSTYRYY